MSRRGRWAAAAAVVLVAAAATVLVTVAIGSPRTLWTVDGDAVGESLRRAGEGIGVPEPCERRGAARWRCAVEDDPGSGMSGVYVVVVDGDCWRARRVPVPGFGGGGDRLTGCFEALDFLPPS